MAEHSTNCVKVDSLWEAKRLYAPGPLSTLHDETNAPKGRWWYTRLLEPDRCKSIGHPGESVVLTDTRP